VDVMSIPFPYHVCYNGGRERVKGEG